MSSKDHRYYIIKPMLLAGKIQTFLDIFQYIPPSVVAIDLGKRGPRFSELMNALEGFTLKELLTLADLFELTRTEIFELVDNQLSTRIDDKSPD